MDSVWNSPVPGSVPIEHEVLTAMPIHDSVYTYIHSVCIYIYTYTVCINICVYIYSVFIYI